MGTRSESDSVSEESSRFSAMVIPREPVIGKLEPGEPKSNLLKGFSGSSDILRDEEDRLKMNNRKGVEDEKKEWIDLNRTGVAYSATCEALCGLAKVPDS